MKENPITQASNRPTRAAERELAYREAEAAGKVLTEEFQVPGPSADPLDRGECLEVLDNYGGDAFPFLRCDGRLRSDLRYVEGRGYLTRWVCSKCGKVVVV